jgi:sugar phosphate permease
MRGLGRCVLLPLSFSLIRYALQTVFMATSLFLIGVGTSGPKTLIGVSVRETVPFRAIGLAGGILGIVGQLGGAAAGVVLGFALQHYGWEVFMPLLLASSVACAILLLLFILSQPGGNRAERTKTDKEK